VVVLPHDGIVPYRQLLHNFVPNFNQYILRLSADTLLTSLSVSLINIGAKSSGISSLKTSSDTDQALFSKVTSFFDVNTSELLENSKNSDPQVVGLCAIKNYTSMKKER
jgi:hypothetical protein